jgi:hypothetical protein
LWRGVIKVNGAADYTESGTGPENSASRAARSGFSATTRRSVEFRTIRVRLLTKEKDAL